MISNLDFEHIFDFKSLQNKTVSHFVNYNIRNDLVRKSVEAKITLEFGKVVVLEENYRSNHSKFSVAFSHLPNNVKSIIYTDIFIILTKT